MIGKRALCALAPWGKKGIASSAYRRQAAWARHRHAYTRTRTRVHGYRLYSPANQRPYKCPCNMYQWAHSCAGVNGMLPRPFFFFCFRFVFVVRQRWFGKIITQMPQAARAANPFGWTRNRCREGRARRSISIEWDGETLARCGHCGRRR